MRTDATQGILLRTKRCFMSNKRICCASVRDKTEGVPA